MNRRLGVAQRAMSVVRSIRVKFAFIPAKIQASQGVQ